MISFGCEEFKGGVIPSGHGPLVQDCLNNWV